MRSSLLAVIPNPAAFLTPVRDLLLLFCACAAKHLCPCGNHRHSESARADSESLR
jgi:hypothetical protein